MERMTSESALLRGNNPYTPREVNNARIPFARTGTIHLFAVPNRGLGTGNARDFRVEFRAESMFLNSDATSVFTAMLRPECARELAKALIEVARAADMKNIAA